MEKPKKYCVYAKRPGILGWWQGWIIVSISDDPIGFEGGYSADAYHMGMKIMSVVTTAPIPYRFHRLPKNFEVLSKVVEKPPSHE